MPVGADIAIRRGIMPTVSNKGRGNQPPGTDYKAESEEIGKSAASMMESMLLANGSASSMIDAIKEHKTLIAVSIAGLVCAYHAISAHVNNTDQKRKIFEDELQAQITTFCVREQKEFSRLSAPEQAVIGFFRRLNAFFPKLSHYTGVKCVQNADGTIRYFGLPLHMVRQLELPNASPHLLDQAINSIYLLFESKAVQTDKKIADDFRADFRVLAPFVSFIEGDNYLDDRRAPRLILNALFNILWNLIHPVDCETGFSLSAADSMQLCSQFSRFLNEYLADKTSGGPHQIHSDEGNDLVRMIQHIEMKTEVLNQGINDEHRRTFKLKELPNVARQTLRELVKSLLQLIYSRIDPVTKIAHPDPLAAKDVADYTSTLNNLLSKNETFLKLFDTERTLIPRTFLENTFINPNCITVIDALIIFSHLTPEQRVRFIERIKNLPQATEQSRLLARELNLFATHYITPLEKALGGKWDHLTPAERSRSLSRIFMPLLTLVVADFRIGVDTRTSSALIKQTRRDGISPYLSGGEQVQLINDAAQEHAIRRRRDSTSKEDQGYTGYRWFLSPFLDLTDYAAKAIDSLAGKLHRMTQTTELLDYLSELTLNYRSFLQYRTFQVFLQDCLQRVGKEYSNFSLEATEMERQLSLDGHLDRTVKAVLLTMVAKLTDNLKAVKRVNDDLSRIVSADDFTELRKQELEKHIRRIENKFLQLFGKMPDKFTETCKNILVNTDIPQNQAAQQARAEALYSLILEFFNETQATLLGSKPNLPAPPNFLSAGKADKIDKYLKMIQHAIDYIKRLQAEKEYRLDSATIINQLSMITENGIQKRRLEDAVKSSFCKVIIAGLGMHLQKPASPGTGRATDATILPEQSSPMERRQVFFPHHSGGGGGPASRPSGLVLPESEIASDEENDEPQAHLSNAAFHRIKKELIVTLQRYIVGKQQERPTNWIAWVFHVFKTLFGLLSNFIRNRLLDTKIRVAQKVIHGLERLPATVDQRSHHKLILSLNEMRTLSHGTLGNKTLYFRESSFWQDFAEVDEEGLHLEVQRPAVSAR